MKRFIQLIVTLVFVLFVQAVQAQLTVTGRVLDAQTKEPLEGASVMEKGTGNGTVTDAKGSFTLKVKGPSSILQIGYVGKKNLELKASGNIEADLQPDNSSLSDVVVTASRQPIRKLQTVTAVEVLNRKEIAAVKPEGLAEMARNSPGIFITNAQGRYRGTIYTRGFPDGTGNGNVYTTILVDGLPTLPTPARPADFNFGMDLGVDKVEVVRGAAATLFGRTSAAGVINAISKTGGEHTHGIFSATQYGNNVDSRSEGRYKIEGNLNGAITKKIRYNLAGFALRDEGYRDFGYPDRGHQLRANFDFLLKRGSKIRVFAGSTNLVIQNMIDIPYDPISLKPRTGWDIYGSYYQPSLDTVRYRVVEHKERGAPWKGYDTLTRSIKQSFQDGNYAKGFNLGFEVIGNLGKGWSIINRFRAQRYKEGTKFNLGSSSLYNENRGSNFRILIDGDAEERGLVEEFRIQKQIFTGKSSHTLDLGFYASREDYRPQTYSLIYWAKNNYRNDSTGQYIIPGVSTRTNWAPFTNRFGGRSRVEDYYEDVFSIFFGDEMKLKDERLTVNFGIRGDWLDIDMRGYNRVDTVITRREKTSDWTMSLGGNYLITPSSALYGNYVRAFRMPDYSAFTVLGWGFNSSVGKFAYTNAPLGVPKNEIINSFELGYRNGIKDFGFDVAAFYSTIKNRLAVFYENGIGISKPVGSNRTSGVEVSVNYVSSAVRGLSLRTNFTYQKSVFTDLDIAVAETGPNSARVPRIDPNGNLYGNTLRQIAPNGTVVGAQTFPRGRYVIDLTGKQVPVVPKMLFNFVAAYDHKYFGINASYNLTGTRYEDPTNLIKLPNYSIINIGAHIKYKLKNGNVVRLDYIVKNATNEDRAFRVLYYGDNDNALFLKQAGTNLSGSYYSGIPQLPRRSLLTLSYGF